MKNKLLITTALVAAFTATNAYAEDLIVSAGNDTTISEEKEFENIDVTGGNLNINGTSAASSGNISISGGTVTLTPGSEILSENGVVNISGGTINMDKGDISADTKLLNVTGGTLDLKNGSNLWSDIGNINISGSDTSITLDNSKIIIEPENYTQNPDDQATITISGGNIDLNNNSQIVAGATGLDGAPSSSKISIQINGGTINFDETSSISLTEKNTGDLNISGGKITGTEIGNYGKGNVNISGGEITASDIGAEQGNVVISNGTVNVIMADGADSEGLYASDTMSIKGGTVNMSGNGNRIWGDKISMTGGTLNVKDSTTFETKNAVDISGGTVNIAENSSLGWSDITDNSIMNLGSQATLNLDGTLNSHINSTGNINFQNNAAKIAGNVTMNNGGVMNVGLNHAVVDGDATFNSGSTLKIEVADTDNHGSLKANNVTGNDGAKLSLNVTKILRRENKGDYV